MKLGRYGCVGLDASLRWLNAVGKDKTIDAQTLTVTGEIGIKAQIEVFFISYGKILWSKKTAEYTFKSDDWDSVDNYWKQMRQSQSTSGMFTPANGLFATNLMAVYGDTAIYAEDAETKMPDRDYLEEYNRSYDSSGPAPVFQNSGISMFSLFGNRSPVVETLKNSYS